MGDTGEVALFGFLAKAFLHLFAEVIHVVFRHRHANVVHQLVGATAGISVAKAARLDRCREYSVKPDVKTRRAFLLVDSQTGRLAEWGSTSVGINSPVDNVILAYSASARRFCEIAAKAKADILLSNHGRIIDFAKRAGANRANPAGPNAFILNNTRVRNYLAVADHCGQAIALAQGAKK